MSASNQNVSVLPQHVVVHLRTGSAIGRIFAWAGWAGFLLSVGALVSLTVAWKSYFDTSEELTEKYYSGEKDSLSPDKVAIIQVSGIILDQDESGYVKRQINRVRDDKSVKAVVLRVNTPGGTVTGSDYIYHHLKHLREEREIPLVVSMGGSATSGGYYVSMAVGDQDKSIFAEPTTVTGSIGVILQHYNLTGLMERFNVTDESISSHPRKQMLSMTKPMPEEHREILQGHINEMFERFKGIVKSGRPKFEKDEAALNELATGEIFSADKAKKLGLIDDIGFIETAIERAIELAKLNSDEVRVVNYPPPVALFDLGILSKAKSQPFDAATVLDLSTPRAWYLTSALPALAASRQPD